MALVPQAHVPDEKRAGSVQDHQRHVAGVRGPRQNRPHESPVGDCHLRSEGIHFIRHGRHLRTGRGNIRQLHEIYGRWQQRAGAGHHQAGAGSARGQRAVGASQDSEVDVADVGEEAGLRAAALVELPGREVRGRAQVPRSAAERGHDTRDIGDELRHEAAGGSGNGGNEDIDQSGAVLAGGHAARVTHEGVLREERNQAAVLRNTVWRASDGQVPGEAGTAGTEPADRLAGQVQEDDRLVGRVGAVPTTACCIEEDRGPVQRVGGECGHQGSAGRPVRGWRHRRVQIGT